MSRERMVTRTISGKRVTYLGLNVVTSEPFNETVEVGGYFKDTAKLEKYLKTNFDTEERKVVSIVNVEEFETLYGMTEKDFLRYAKVMPDRKAVIVNPDTETEE